MTASNRYGLLDDFQGLDLVTNENGKESVFAIQYSMNDGTECLPHQLEQSVEFSGWRQPLRR